MKKNVWDKLKFKKIVQHFGKHTHLLSCYELEGKINNITALRLVIDHLI